jgi:hypothetical protein
LGTVRLSVSSALDNETRPSSSGVDEGRLAEDAFAWIEDMKLPSHTVQWLDC